MFAYHESKELQYDPLLEQNQPLSLFEDTLSDPFFGMENLGGKPTLTAFNANTFLLNLQVIQKGTGVRENTSSRCSRDKDRLPYPNPEDEREEKPSLRANSFEEGEDDIYPGACPKTLRSPPRERQIRGIKPKCGDINWVETSPFSCLRTQPNTMVVLHPP
ncbi:unnamed protein product [Cuscuta campestris]|uniref:Uncharacterized protein n=1 Tax=Cuscuta campestris TaxID=132261 RepID=A0A484KZR7_9ASTE|nr:unnamed protein product [Cuscuta campestris]